MKVRRGMLNRKVRLVILALIVLSLATALGLACPPGGQSSQPADRSKTSSTSPSIKPDPISNNPIGAGPKTPPGGGGPTDRIPISPDTSRLADIDANIQRLSSALRTQEVEVAKTSKLSTDAATKLQEADKVEKDAYGKWAKKYDEYMSVREQLSNARATLEKDQEHHILTVAQYEKVLNKIRELEAKKENLGDELFVFEKKLKKAESERDKAFDVANETSNASIAAQAKQQEITNNLRGWQATRDLILGRVRDFR